MKHIIPWLAVMCLLLPLKTIAQDEDAFGKRIHRFDGCLTLGTNFSQIDGDTYDGYHKVGIKAGHMVYLHIGSMFGISLEMLYSQKGVRGGTIKDSYSLGQYIDKYYVNLNYAELPLVIHFRFNPFMEAEGGISWSQLISSKEWAESDAPVVIYPDLNRFNSSAWDYIAGLTLHFAKHWSGNMRYEYSFKTIRPYQRVPLRYTAGCDEYSNCFSLRVIYIL